MKNLLRIISLASLVFVVSCGGGGALTAVDGAVDLSGGIAPGEIVKLDGTWNFYWKKLLPPDQIPSGRSGSVPVTVPSIWNGVQIGSETIPGKGYATYHAVITLPYDEDIYAFKILDAATSYRLYVDGRLIAENGKVAESEEAYIPEYRPQTAAFTLTKPAEGNISSVDVVIHVSNYYHRKGGIWESIRFGRFEDIAHERDRRLALEMFLFGFIFIMVIYHFGLFLLRREDRSTLYFGLFCLTLALKAVLGGERAVMIFIPGISWTVLTRLEYFGSYTNMLFVVLFVYSLFGEKLPAIM
ncbi:MAG: 7TM diverse intracellular signaling domain-containing protein, partial [Spirochaetota bacterium]